MTEPEYEHAAASEAAAGGALRQLEEGGWEWTSSALEPLPGGLGGLHGLSTLLCRRVLGITPPAPPCSHTTASAHLTCAVNVCVCAGFEADPLYPEYSTDFFDGQHMVLRGSEPYTHPSLRRRSFRNWYQPLYPYVLAKFRLVRDISKSE
jgi:formylglycine-generating enzyme required for sulfatase activity